MSKSIKKLYSECMDVLSNADVENVEIFLDDIFCNALSTTRNNLYLGIDDPVSLQSESKILDYCKRVANGEPLQYVLGKTVFYGNEFIVGSGVLIPRPETEILVENAIKWIDARAKSNPPIGNIKCLDLCCGSANICVSIAEECKYTTWDAVDISKKALDYANKNISLHNLQERITLCSSNLFDEVHEKYDLIVSNPPYVPSDILDKLPFNVKNYEPKIALDGGADGNAIFNKIIKEAKQHIKNDGCIIVELHEDNLEKAKETCIKQDFNDCEIIKDMSGKYRFIKVNYS